MKKLLSLLLCLALVLSLAACGGEPAPTDPPTAAPTAPPTEPPTTEPPITVEDVYADVLEAMKTNEASRMQVVIGFSASYTEGEAEDAVTTEVSFYMLMDIMVSSDPVSCYNLSSIAFDASGMEMEIEVEVFVVEEDGKIVTYTKAFDSWFRQETGMTAEEYLSSGNAPEVETDEIWSGDAMPADMTLDDFTGSLNGKEVYILRCTTALPDLHEALTEMGVEMDADAAQIAMPVTYYVDAQNYTVMRAEADMSVLTDLLSAAMAEALIGTDAEAGAVTVEISNAVYDLGYGPQEIPALPQEALDQTQVTEPTEPAVPEVLPVAGEASDLGNGSFVLPCGDEAIVITCPENWTGEVYEINNIWIYNEDKSLYGDFYYLTDWTEDDFRDQVQQDANELKDWDIFISSGEGPAYAGYTTMQVMGEGESYCYAWTPKGEGYLLIVLADYTAEPDFETMLNELLGLVTPYTGEFAEKAVAEDLGNGTFSLPCDTQTAIITCPEGWSGEVYTDYNIWTYNGDDSIYGDFFYLDYYTAEDVMTYWVQSDADTMKSDNTFLSLEDGPAIEGYSTQVLQGNDISYYYAWTPMGNGYFLLKVYDWDGGNDATELLPMVLDFASFE